MQPIGSYGIIITKLNVRQLMDGSRLRSGYYTRPETVPVNFTLPLKDLAPGRYTAQINVVDQVERKFAFPRSPLVIVP